MVLKSGPYDISMIVLIVLYTLLIFIFFGLEEQFCETEGETDCIEQDTFYYIELVILGIFCIEITAHFLTYYCLYFKDCWNIFDILIIILSIIMVFIDMYIDNETLEGILKIRGIFRLLRVFILIRKLNALRVKREVRRKRATTLGYDLRSPLEKVLEILTDLRDKMESTEERVIEDLNYCIKMIQSNQLYEIDVDLADQGGDSKNH